MNGLHPRVYDTVVKVLSFPSKGAIRGPGLDNEVVGLLKPLAILCRVDVCLEALHRGSANETGNDAPAGYNVHHGDLFGDAYRIVGDGDHIAKNGNLAIFRDLGDGGGVDICGGFHAPPSIMVLIGHDTVEANLVGQSVLLVVLIVQLVSLPRVKELVAQGEVRILLVLGQIFFVGKAVGLLCKPVNLNRHGGLLWQYP